MALAAARSMSAPWDELGPLNGRGELDRLSGSSHFHARKFPNCCIYTNKNHAWRVWMQLGPQTSGASTNWLQPVISSPPVMRKTPVRELLAFLRAQGRDGIDEGFPLLAVSPLR